MIRLLPFVFFVALFLPHANAQWQQVTSSAGFASVAPAVFVIDNHAYYVCGRDSSQVWRYTPATDEWLRLGDHPGGARAFAFAFALNGKGYVGAGDPKLDTLRAVNDFWEYDPGTDVWTRKADFGYFPRAGAFAFSYNGLGYVGGGYWRLGAFSDMNTYNPSTDSWTTRTQCPEGPFSTSVCIVIDGKAYIGTGSQSKTSNTDRWWEYDIANDSWTYKPPFPGGPRQGCVGFAAGGKAVVGCGINGKYARATVYNDFFAYDPRTNSWELFDALAFPSDYNTWLRSFVIDNVAYLGWGAKMPGRHMETELFRYSFGSMITSDAPSHTLNFGAIMLGASKTKKLTLQNAGSEPLTIQNIGITGTQAAEFSVSSIPLPLELQSGSTAELDVQFTPAANANANATFQVFSNAANTAVYEVDLVGAGGQASPVIVLTPSAYDFGTIDEGTSEEIIFQMHNEGTATLNVSNVELANNGAGGFTLLPLSLPILVDPGRSEFISIRFQPPKEGSFSAQLKVTSNAANGAVTTRNLQGVARDVVRTAVYSKTTIDFGGVEIGSQGNDQIDVLCSSVAPVLISSIAIINDTKGGFSFDIAELPFEITSGNKASISVSFLPDAEGNFSADFVLNTNADGEKQKIIRLTGIGYSAQASAMSVSPDPLAFGGVKVQATETLNLNVQSVGGLSLRVESIVMEETGGGSFTLGNVSVPFTLASGGTKKVPVIFTPKKSGPLTGRLRINSNAGGSESITVDITGFGAEDDGPVLTVSQPEMAFGDVPTNASMDAAIVLRSTGTEVVTIQSVTIEGPDADAFSTDGIPANTAIAPGDEYALAVQFAPQAQRSHSATLRIQTNIPGQNNITVPLSGNGVQPSAVDRVAFLPASSYVVHPNPVVSGRNIYYTYEGMVPQRVSLSLIDVAGRTWLDVPETELVPGTHLLVLPEVLSAGRYYIALRTHAQMLTIPLVVIAAP